MALSDLEILYEVQKGNTALFREIIDRYKDRAFSLALKVLKNRNEAEDALQESFLKVYRATIAKHFEEKSKFSTYFYSIVYNTAVDYYRKYYSKSFNVSSIEVTDKVYRDGDELSKGYYETKIEGTAKDDYSNLDAERTIDENEIKVIVNKYINSIPEQYSVILNMFYINDLTHEEISKILKIPLGTVKNRIFRAKEKLKEILLKEFSPGELLEYIR